MSIVGRTYLERGRPVVVLQSWRTAWKLPPAEFVADEPITWVGTAKRSGPRNVLIRRESGELVVRPFRGLRRPDA